MHIAQEVDMTLMEVFSIIPWSFLETRTPTHTHGEEHVICYNCSRPPVVSAFKNCGNMSKRAHSPGGDGRDGGMRLKVIAMSSH